MTKDRVIGIIGLIISCTFLFLTATTVKLVPNAIEPGPRLMPYLASGIIAFCSFMLIITSKQEEKSKPFFPKGGLKRISIAYATLVAYGVLLHVVGFVVSTPFAMCAFITMLKGQYKVKLSTTIIVSLVVTAALYLMFVKGFSIQLPTGLIF